MNDSSHSRTRVHFRLGTRAAFTLVEALLAITFTAMAGSALLLGIGGSLQSTSDAMHETVAQGMAQQLMDEVLGGRYASDQPNGAGPREVFNDAEDYNTLRITPPEDPSGIELGKEDKDGEKRHVNFWAPTDPDSGNIAFFRGWRQEVEVEVVDNVNLPAGFQVRAIVVRIIREVPGVGPRELASLRRVVTYVPPLP